jgi:hypothetical protein
MIFGGLEFVAAKYVGAHLLAAHAAHVAALHPAATQAGARTLTANGAVAPQPTGAAAAPAAPLVNWHTVGHTAARFGEALVFPPAANRLRESAAWLKPKEALSELFDEVKDVKDLKDLKDLLPELEILASIRH